MAIVQTKMLSRIRIYLSEMFPLSHCVPSLLISLSFFMALALLGSQTLALDAVLVAATLSIIGFALMLRIMDEFKDYADDLVNYPQRPLPSGRVFAKDLKIFLAVVMASLVLLNSWQPELRLGAGIVIGYSLLMFKWFFREAQIRSSLPLALLSHNPIVYINFLYLYLVYATTVTTLPLSYLLIALPLGATFTHWEISRKIRLPQLETAYTTYSKIWGFRRILAVCLGIQAFTFVGMQAFFFVTGSPLLLTMVFSIVFLACSGRYVQFARSETSPAEHWHPVVPLRKYAEWQALACQLSIIILYAHRLALA